MDIKKVIEAHRKRLDRMARESDNLSELLEEAKKMDRLFEIYEAKRRPHAFRKMHKDDSTRTIS